MGDVVGDVVRRVLGVNGDASFKEWIENCCTVCVVSTVHNPELLNDVKFDLFRELGVKVQSLQLPALPTFVSGTNALATVEWELALTDAFVRRALREPVGVAVAIAHLRAIRQSLASDSQKWVCIFRI